MNYLKFPLNDVSEGVLVEVKLDGVECDVFLVDDTNLHSFERGASFRYTGGHYNQSPVRLHVPSAGSWTVVVVPGLGGAVRASVRTFARA